MPQNAPPNQSSATRREPATLSMLDVNVAPIPESWNQLLAQIDALTVGKPVPRSIPDAPRASPR